MKFCQSKMKDDAHTIASAARRGRVELDAAIQEVRVSVAREHQISSQLLETYVTDRLRDALIENSARRR